MIYLLKSTRQALPLAIFDENGKRSSFVLKSGEEVVCDYLSNQVKNLEKINLIRVKKLVSLKNKNVRKLRLF